MGNKSKFRHKSKHTINKRLLVPIEPNRQIKKVPNKIITHKFSLTEVDREIYSYEIDNQGIIQKVVDVSYDIYIDNHWITIVRYDSEHGFLHRHTRVSLEYLYDTPTTGGVIKRGGPQTWLTWARKDISKNYLNYRVGFFRRCKRPDLY